jgi:hypothetical protein
VTELPAHVVDRAEALLLRFVGPPSGCWVWPGDPKQYPKVRVGGRTVGAHRFVMLRTRLNVDPKLYATHSCDNKRCVNPNHIRPRTNGQNIAEAYERGLNPRIHGAILQRTLQTHCIHGHEFTEANTKRTARGTRDCRRCHADREAARRAR